jgi:hypothetical protein
MLRHIGRILFYMKIRKSIKERLKNDSSRPTKSKSTSSVRPKYGNAHVNG